MAGASPAENVTMHQDPPPRLRAARRGRLALVVLAAAAAGTAIVAGRNTLLRSLASLGHLDLRCFPPLATAAGFAGAAVFGLPAVVVLLALHYPRARAIANRACAIRATGRSWPAIRNCAARN
jgi:hypothetical protein